MDKSLTKQDFWEKYWVKYLSDEIYFKDLFNEYLPKIEGLNCIEIGCSPGNYLVYFKKEFKYNIFGIDFSGIEITKKGFKKANIDNFILYNEDFLKFKINRKFNIVCSFGFIEHFRNYLNIFKKHVELLENNGLLIIELPNYNNLQYYLHLLLDKKNMERHNIEIMDLEVLKKLCNKFNLEIIHLNYYKTANFWINENDNPNIIKKIFAKLLRFLLNFLNFFYHPNKHTSPFIFLVAKKL